MATVKGAISVQILDGNGARASTPVLITADDTKTIAELMGDALLYANGLDGVTDGLLERLTLSVINENPAELGAKTAPVAGCDITQTATFDMTATGYGYVEGVVVPAFINAGVVGGKVDLSNLAVTTFVNDLKFVYGTIRFVNRAWLALTGISSALFSFRKRRKAIARRTKS